jgi:CHAT domain-containing protein/tetratricopeptide (TPR) repeat protein
MTRAARFSPLAAALLFVLGCSRQPESRPALGERIAALRLEGKFEAAREAAERQAALCRRDRDAPADECDDAERVARRLARAAALPAAAQAELAAAERMARDARELYEAGDAGGARALLERHLEPLERHLGGGDPEVAAALRTLGSLTWAIEDGTAALPYFARALAIDERTLGPAHPAIAEDLLALADAALEAGDEAAAESHAVRAREIATRCRGEGSPQCSAALRSLAGVRVAQGDLAAAEVLHERARAILAAAAGVPAEDRAAAANDYANLLLEIGDYARAASLLEEVVEIDRELQGENSLEYAQGLVNLASANEQRGEHLLAEAQYSKAAELLRGLGEPAREDLATCLTNLAVAYTDRGRHDRAEPLYREALAFDEVRHGREARKVADVSLLLARDLRQQGRYEESEEFYRRALAIYRRRLAPSHADLGRCFYSYGSLLDDRGEYVRAESLYAASAAVFEAARARVGLGYGRATFQRSPYPKLANVRLRLGRPEAAWPATERGHGRVLAEQLIAYGRPTWSDAERAEEDSLAALLEAAEAGLLEDENSAEARSRLAEAEARWAEFRQRLAAQKTVSAGEPYPLHRVQASLGPRAALVGWVDAEERPGSFVSWVYVVRPEGAVRWARIRAPEGEPDPFAAARAFVAALSGARPEAAARGFTPARPPTPAAAEARNRRALGMWSRLEPVAGELRDVDELVVVPSGSMLGVPVEPIRTPEGRSLGSLFDISYVPSATIHAWLRERRPAPRPGGLEAILVGDPPFAAAAQAGGAPIAGFASLPALPGTRREVEALARILPGARLLVGPEASEERLWELRSSGAIERARVLHFATHALVDDERPERSVLVLSQAGLRDPAAAAGSRRFDGLLRAQEIVRGWRTGADLVVLSACETGLGRRVDGEGYIGFAQAFFQVGARCLLLSLWKVDDRATALLMTRFYDNLWGTAKSPRGPGSMTKAAALREAKTWLREQEIDGRNLEDPYFWSGFVLIGDAASTP